MMVFLIQSIWILFFFTIANSALGNQTSQEKCSSVDYRSQLPPARNQGSSALCYAFSVADLLSFASGKPISSLDIALTHDKSLIVSYFKFSDLVNKQERFLDIFDKSILFPSSATKLQTGGVANLALKRAMEKGLCLEKDAPSESETLSSIVEEVENLEKLKSSYDEFVKNEQMNSHFLFPAEISNDEKMSFVCRSYSESSTIMGALPLSEFIDVLEHSSKRNFLTHLIDRSCKNRLSLDKKVKTFRDNNPVLLQEKMHTLLDEGNMAIIGWDTTAVRDPFAIDSYRPAHHASTIVGRRWNESRKSCQFLVRDSTDPSCKSYHYLNDCEEGHLWVDDKRFMRFVDDLTYFE